MVELSSRHVFSDLEAYSEWFNNRSTSKITDWHGNSLTWSCPVATQEKLAEVKSRLGCLWISLVNEDHFPIIGICFAGKWRIEFRLVRFPQVRYNIYLYMSRKDMVLRFDRIPSPPSPNCKRLETTMNNGRTNQAGPIGDTTRKSSLLVCAIAWWC